MRKLILLISIAISANSYSQNAKKLIETIKSGQKLDLSLIYPKSTQAERTNAIIQKIDSIKTWEFDTTNLNWKTDAKNKFDTYVYDANDRLSSRVYHYFSSPVWYTGSKEDISYNSNNDITQMLISSLSGTVWTPSNKTDFVYNTSNNLLSRISSFYNWSSSNWDNNSRTTYTYNLQQKNTNELSEYWNSSSSVWEPNYKITKSYNANGYQLTYAHETYSSSIWVKNYRGLWTYGTSSLATSYTNQVGNGTVWVNDTRELYTYDINGNPNLYTLETWTNNAWATSARASFTVVSNNITAIVVEDWISGNWVKSWKIMYTYNSASKPLTETEQYWSGTAWVNSNRYVQTYDANGNETSNQSLKWQTNSWLKSYANTSCYDVNSFKYCSTSRWYESNGSTVGFGDSSKTYYKTVVGIHNNKADQNQLSVYPNPGKGVFTIGNAKDITSLKVYNIQGIEVFNTKVESVNTSIDISNLPAGMYFIRANSGNTPIIHKVIIE
jgi:hypothetical protein